MVAFNIMVNKNILKIYVPNIIVNTRAMKNTKKRVKLTKMKIPNFFDLVDLINKSTSSDASLKVSADVTSSDDSAPANPPNICLQPLLPQIIQIQSVCFTPEQQPTCVKDCFDLLAPFSAAQKDNNCDTGMPWINNGTLTMGDLISSALVQTTISCVKVNDQTCPPLNETGPIECTPCLKDQNQALQALRPNLSKNIVEMIDQLANNLERTCGWKAGSWAFFASLNIPIVIIALLL